MTPLFAADQESMQKGMQILFVTELWPPNSGTFIFEQIRSLADHASATVVVLVPIAPDWPRYRAMRSPLADMPAGPCLMPELERAPIYYLRYRTIPELGKYINSLLALRALKYFLNRQHERFDLIHAHFAYIVGFAAARAGRRFHIPVIITAYGSDINFYSRRLPRNWVAAMFTIWGLRHAVAITVLSENLKKKVLALGVSEQRISIIPLGIRPTVFFPQGEKRHLRQKMQLQETAIYFLYVGNFVSVKGLEVLLEAFALVSQQLPQAKLVMVGSGELELTLKAQAQKLEIDRQVIWQNRKSHSEIPLWMSAADFLVLPSLSEGYGLVVLEALACGTPVIASRVGGVPEILISSDLGMMAPPGDSDALVRAMLEAAAKKWDAKKLVDYAHSNTWTERAQRFLQIYQNVLAAERRASRS
jgi:glycosyltransferase involved in cell wall biosynthesis